MCWQARASDTTWALADNVKVTFLGGLGDIGRNCATIEAQGSLLLLDCGQMFPDEFHPGVESILPDLSYIKERADRVVGCIATHGHEDHIGALGYLLRDVSFPVYGSRFTLGLAERKVKEFGVLHRTRLIAVADGEHHRIGPFDCEFIPVTHSVPGGVITAISTPQGKILHSCDFKLDLFPVDGRRTGLARIGAISSEAGIRLFLADSTNAEMPGSSRSESDIGGALDRLFAAQNGRRIITACFASHLHRVQQIVTAALACGRKVVTLGLSMKNNVALGRQLGLLKIPESSFMQIEECDTLDPGEVCVISTGSQAEPRSSLATAAAGGSRWIRIDENDTVVLSSNPIPGNEVRVSRMINDLLNLGARVIHPGEIDIHTSGHGRQNELATLHHAAAPEWFVPVHGELRHLRAHAALAKRLGMPESRVLLARDGDQIVMEDASLRLRPSVTTGDHLLVHGPFIAADGGVLNERAIIGEQGVVVASVAVDLEGLCLAADPLVVSRGWLDQPQADDLMTEIAEDLTEAISAKLAMGFVELAELRQVVRKTVGSLVNSRSGRRPAILPLVTALHE